jgi:Ca2+:H+ antiporter
MHRHRQHNALAAKAADMVCGQGTLVFVLNPGTVADKHLVGAIQQPPRPTRQVSMNPEATTPKGKKPAMSRRSSSKYQAPYRGQEFSTDDDPNEYESDVKSMAKTATGLGPGTLRKMPSTIRRRQTGPALSRVDSRGEEEEGAEAEASGSKPVTLQRTKTAETLRGDDPEDVDEAEADDAEGTEEDGDMEDDEDDLSDAESFTLKDRQTAINQTHPFGIRVWKPALYKKNRSVEKNAESDIHSAPGGRVNRWLWFFNLLWTILFGWWLALFAAIGALVCFFVSWTPGAAGYGCTFWGLARYIFYPFGKFVKLAQDEAYAEEDEGEGRSITEYEQWQSGDIEDGRLFFGPDAPRGIIGRRRGSLDSADENDSLLGHARDGGQSEDNDNRKRRLFGRGQWTLGRVVFYTYFYLIMAPLLLLVSLSCWFLVFWIPMGKVAVLLFDHMRRHPLALSFHNDGSYSRAPSTGPSSILVCTYRAVGTRYWKYTVDGTNIFLINLMGVVLFSIFDYWVLNVAMGVDSWLTHPGFVFCLSLFSIIPLAYFIGQAVASISAQSSMGVGAAINAFFSTVVEVFLYCVALQQGKGALVEGSIIGSIFAGILFLPGLSMCFGAINRKTQRFNVKSAGVTSTMLLFAMIAAFSPTLFYQIYGSHELKCSACITTVEDSPVMDSDCRRCFFTQNAAINDRFFVDAVRPYCWFAAVMLFLSYLIGLWFTLRTHAAVIWNNEPDEKRPTVTAPNGSLSQPSHLHAPKSQSMGGSMHRGSVRESQLYQRILGQSLKQIGMKNVTVAEEASTEAQGQAQTQFSPKQASPFMPPPRVNDDNSTIPNSMSNSMAESFSFIQGLSHEQSEHLTRQVAEVAATAATVAARDATRHQARRVGSTTKSSTTHHAQPDSARKVSRPPTVVDETEELFTAEAAGHSAGGHDAPNWGRMKSAVILLVATLLYAVIAEILVNTVDIVLESVDIDEKFLGITLFALVPNTTEFLNAISFAMNGNIALSMEIGSAYALQVCLLQIPALVLFSAVNEQWIDPVDLIDHTFK